MSFGIWELGIVLAIVALLFGTKKLGTMGSDIGSAIKGLRNALKDDESGTAKQQDEPADGKIIEGEVENDKEGKQAGS